MSRVPFPLLLLLAIAAGSCGDADPVDVVEGPPPDWQVRHADDHWWLSVVAVSESDRWIAGGTPAQGKILHYDGTTFTEVDHGQQVGLLNWIHRYPDGGLVVVGNEGAILRRAAETWTRETSPTQQDLWGVWGASPNDTWSVGGKGLAEGDATILRDTGSGFVPVPLPKLERPGVNALYKVWGSSASDVYIVGQSGAVLHWNGSVLSERLVGVSDDLIAVWGTGPDRVVCIGGRNNGVAALWDGSAWRALDLAPVAGLNGVWLRGNAVHVVGAFGTAATLDFTTGQVTDVLVDTTVDLHAIHGSADGFVTSVGGNFVAQGGPYEGAIADRALLGSE